MQYVARWRLQLAARLIERGASLARRLRRGRLRIRGRIQPRVQEVRRCAAGSLAQETPTADRTTRRLTPFSDEPLDVGDV